MTRSKSGEQWAEASLQSCPLFPHSPISQSRPLAMLGAQEQVTATDLGRRWANIRRRQTRTQGGRLYVFPCSPP